MKKTKLDDFKKVTNPAEKLYNEMAHGDDNHKKWLKDHLDDYFKNKIVLEKK